MPKIGIVGSQNVGKSTLFNSLIKKRKSITFDEPGITRDLVSEKVNWGDGFWEVTDFPGLENKKNLGEDLLTIEAIERVAKNLQDYNLLLWVVHRKGLSEYEHNLLNILRKVKSPVWLVVNYVDDPSLESEASEFYKLGFEQLFFVSALNSRNIRVLREGIVSYFQSHETVEVKTEDASLRLAIIGKPNAGKSTLFNTLLNKDRALVFDQPGTTRDTLEETFIHSGKLVKLMDTAGLRKKSALKDLVEIFSIERTKKAIADCDVVVYILNCLEGADRQNKSIIEAVENAMKPIVFVLNKVDLIDETERELLEEDVVDLNKMYWKFPHMFITALDRKKVLKIIDKAFVLNEKATTTKTTADLNKLLDELKSRPILQSHNVKLNYITQGTPKNRFIIFTNKMSLPENIVRFLKNEIQRRLNWLDIPLSLSIRKK